MDALLHRKRWPIGAGRIGRDSSGSAGRGTNDCHIPAQNVREFGGSSIE